MSVNDAMRKMMIARTYPLIPNQRSATGVSRTTTSKGTMTILVIVR